MNSGNWMLDGLKEVSANLADTQRNLSVIENILIERGWITKESLAKAREELGDAA